MPVLSEIVMAKKGDARVLVTLACQVCRERTYNTSKNKRNTTDRVEFNKYCPRCQSHQVYKEIR